ncbi:MAG: hypothetical protein ACRDQ1_08510 [Sciscionella sp.]
MKQVKRIDQIVEYAHNHDFATDMEHGVWEEDTETDPMVTTSVRLPKSLLDWVRNQAADQHVRTSVLIRQWIEQYRDVGGESGMADLAARMERLERAVFPGTTAS